MSSAYCAKSNMSDVFLEENINTWADPDLVAGTIATRVAKAIDVASDEIDDNMRSSHYLIPLSTPAGATPPAIEDIAAKLAGVWLYESRGVADVSGERGAPLHALSPIKGEANLALANIRTGKRRINAL